jgi:hypothetical protein
LGGFEVWGKVRFIEVICVLRRQVYKFLAHTKWPQIIARFRCRQTQRCAQEVSFTIVIRDRGYVIGSFLQYNGTRQIGVLSGLGFACLCGSVNGGFASSWISLGSSIRGCTPARCRAKAMHAVCTSGLCFAMIACFFRLFFFIFFQS